MWHALFRQIQLEIALLLDLRDEDTDINIMTSAYNTEVTDAASKILRKECRGKTPWIIRDFLEPL